MIDPLVFTVDLHDGRWAGWCSDHGPLSSWTDERWAGMDAIGHAAHFHSGLDTTTPKV